MLMILKFTAQWGQTKECLCKDYTFCIYVDLATFFEMLYVTIDTNYNVWKSIFILCTLYRISTVIHSHLSFHSYTSNFLLDFLMILTFVSVPVKSIYGLLYCKNNFILLFFLSRVTCKNRIIFNPSTIISYKQ